MNGDLKIITLTILGSGGFWAIIQSLITRRQQKKEAQGNKIDLLTKAVLSISHHMIYDECKRYINEGGVTLEDQKELEYLYEPYKELGGNGTAESAYEKVMQLPIKANLKVNEN